MVGVPTLCEDGFVDMRRCGFDLFAAVIDGPVDAASHLLLFGRLVLETQDGRLECVRVRWGLLCTVILEQSQSMVGGGGIWGKCDDVDRVCLSFADRQQRLVTAQDSPVNACFQIAVLFGKFAGVLPCQAVAVLVDFAQSGLCVGFVAQWRRWRCLSECQEGGAVSAILCHVKIVVPVDVFGAAGEEQKREKRHDTQCCPGRAERHGNLVLVTMMVIVAVMVVVPMVIIEFEDFFDRWGRFRGKTEGELNGCVLMFVVLGEADVFDSHLQAVDERGVLHV